MSVVVIILITFKHPYTMLHLISLQNQLTFKKRSISALKRPFYTFCCAVPSPAVCVIKVLVHVNGLQTLKVPWSGGQWFSECVFGCYTEIRPVGGNKGDAAFRVQHRNTIALQLCLRLLLSSCWTTCPIMHSAD